MLSDLYIEWRPRRRKYVRKLHWKRLHNNNNIHTYNIGTRRWPLLPGAALWGHTSTHTRSPGFMYISAWLTIRYTAHVYTVHFTWRVCVCLRVSACVCMCVLPYIILLLLCAHAGSEWNYRRWAVLWGIWYCASVSTMYTCVYRYTLFRSLKSYSGRGR